MANLKRDALIKSLSMEGITDNRVLEAIGNVPRDQFVPITYRSHAYDDNALPIQCKQTISQPYIVANMTQHLFKNINYPDPKILEIGTGSGYQTAILRQLTKSIYTIERIEQLYLQAKQLLTKLHYTNIHFHYGDGNLGWPQAAPFDGIIVTAATPDIPTALLEQLNEDHGRMVIPIGATENQNLVVITRVGDEYQQEVIEQVRFVPLKSGVE